ncbi:MAG TPA: dihydrofolate reductase family protein [Actinomycetota bacterium]|nr:dihydrofolate reductase family protein [Actinomycetota bacterium]
MGRIVVSEFITLDGVMEDPGGAEGTPGGGWAFKFQRGPAGDKYKLDELFAADALLLGRTTYQGFAQAWPNIKDEQGFAERMNGVKHYVVSNTLRDAEATWNNSQVIRGDVVAELTKLRAEPGGDLLVAGSRSLVQTLVANGLVDEYRLMVYPLILGGGKRLFGDHGVPTGLALQDVAPADDGVVMLTYRPIPATQ